MRLSTKGRYAVRAMLELALRQDAGSVQTRDIARVQGISLKYLERLLATLRSAGLVQSRRGANGGFILARATGEITMLDIVTAVEGSLAPVECVDDQRKCKRIDHCAARYLWTKLKQAVDTTLRDISLADLVRIHHDCTHAGRVMYYI